MFLTASLSLFSWTSAAIATPLGHCEVTGEVSMTRRGFTNGRILTELLRTLSSDKIKEISHEGPFPDRALRLHETGCGQG